MSGTGRSDSFGLDWADQWDYKGQDEHINRNEDVSNPSKLSSYNQKVKAAASSGFTKAKSAATTGAEKMKSGTKSGVNWIKEQVAKRKTKS